MTSWWARAQLRIKLTLAIDVYVRYLRDKIDRPFGRSSLETVRGAGYRLDDHVPAVAA